MSIIPLLSSVGTPIRILLLSLPKKSLPFQFKEPLSIVKPPILAPSADIVPEKVPLAAFSSPENVPSAPSRCFTFNEFTSMHSVRRSGFPFLTVNTAIPFPSELLILNLSEEITISFFSMSIPVAPSLIEIFFSATSTTLSPFDNNILAARTSISPEASLI